MRKLVKYQPNLWYLHRKPLLSDVVNVTTKFFNNSINIQQLISDTIIAQQLHNFTYKSAVGWTSIPLRSAGGITGPDASNASGIHASSDGATFNDTCVMQPYIKFIIDTIAGNRNVLKIRLLKLIAGAKIPMHIDKFTGNKTVTRYHIPVITNPAVTMIVNNGKYYLEAGQVYTIDVSQAHAVENNSNEDRIHLVFDCSS